MTHRLTIAVLLFGLSACTTAVGTRPISLDQARIDGVPYALPVLEVETTVTHRLKSCKITTAGADLKYDLEWENKAESKPVYPGAEFFALDYAGLSDGLRTGKFSVDFHDNRMLKSINVAAEDHTVDVAVETLKAGISIARIATGVPVPLGSAGFAPRLPTCPTALLTTRGALEQEQDGITKSIEGWNARLAELNRQASAGTLSSAGKIEFDKIKGQADKAVKRLTAIAKAMAKVDETLALTEAHRWQPSAADLKASPDRQIAFTYDEPNDPLLAARRKAWITALLSLDPADPSIGDVVLDCGDKDSIECLLVQQLSMSMSLSPAASIRSADDAAATATRLGLAASASARQAERGQVAGVIARVPVQGRLLVCEGLQQCRLAGGKPIIDQLVKVPQLGPYIVLPFSNGVGQNNSLNAEFADTGEPTKVVYEEKSAAALQIAKGVSSGADALNGYYTAARKLEEDAAKEQAGAPLAALEAQAKLLEQQKKIAELESALHPADDALKAEEQALTKQAAILRLQVEIRELEGKLAGGGT